LWTFLPDWSWTMILLLFTCWVVRIIDMSYHASLHISFIKWDELLQLWGT
jgi:hypothetical protein